MIDMKKELEDVKKRFGDFPIRDAKVGFKFPITQENIDNAVPLDPFNCVLSLGASNITGSRTGIAVTRHTAYVFWPGENVIERYHVRAEESKRLSHFDETKEWTFGVGWGRFYPPTKSDKLAAKRARSKRAKRSNKTVSVKSHNRSKRRSDSEKQGKVSWLEVRKGIGIAAAVKKTVVEDQNQKE